MNKAALHHLPYGSYAYPLGPETLRVVLRAQKGDLQRACVLYSDRYPGPEEHLQTMAHWATDHQFDYFQADLTLTTRRFMYSFLVDDGSERLFYTEKGVFPDPPPVSGFQYPYIAPGDAWEPPAWAQGAVVYQIFPERFANGDPSNDPKNVEAWDLRPTRQSMKGGDLQGIIDRLDHLSDLGVEVLYLTPIFASPSNHKYNISDYFRIDPHFGDLETCKELVKRCHDGGIKVVFDAVFNHCGFHFFAFQDVVEKGRASKYWDWFWIQDDPVTTDPLNYETFSSSVWNMPKLMTQQPDLKEYLLTAAEYWIKECDIDGWRLDVANEVDHSFWRDFRRRVKALKQDALIIGEIWHDASPWLQGDEFDAVMNYPFRDACSDFLGTGSIRAETFAQCLAKVQMNHRQSVNRAMFNLFGSHDTARFLTVAGGSRKKMRLAAGLLLTYEGAPMLYYGDEVGMEGDNDPDCRRGMIWDETQQDRELLQWYKELISLRRQYPVLKTGSCRIVHADSATNVFGFVRTAPGQELLVLLNNSRSVRTLPLDAFTADRSGSFSGKNLLNGQVYHETIALQSYEFAVIG